MKRAIYAPWMNNRWKRHKTERFKPISFLVFFIILLLLLIKWTFNLCTWLFDSFPFSFSFNGLKFCCFDSLLENSAIRCFSWYENQKNCFILHFVSTLFCRYFSFILFAELWRENKLFFKNIYINLKKCFLSTIVGVYVTTWNIFTFGHLTFSFYFSFSHYTISKVYYYYYRLCLLYFCCFSIGRQRR